MLFGYRQVIRNIKTDDFYKDIANDYLIIWKWIRWKEHDRNQNIELKVKKVKLTLKLKVKFDDYKIFYKIINLY